MSVSGIQNENAVICYHCLSPLVPGKIIKSKIQEKEESFCCNGCRMVAEIIHDSGNEYFYNIRGSQELTPAEFSANTDPLYDSEYTYEEYVVSKNSEQSEVHINILNIHCSACVWLIEKAVKDLPGIKSARINFATGRLYVVWDDGLVKLSRIIAAIGLLGYKTQLYAPWKNESGNEKESRQLLLRMAVAGFSWGNIMLFSAALYAGYFQGIETNFKNLLHYVSWLLATPVFFYSGYPFLKGTLNGFKNRVLTMDFLLILGVSLAYFYSVFVTVSGHGEVYFDTVCTIYFFILIGKYFESLVRVRAARQIGSLLSHLPEESILIENGAEKKILSSRISKGQTVRLLPGDRIPVDGMLLSEPCLLDESFLTGEARPVTRNREEKIMAGSICVSYPVTIFATSSAKDSTLARLRNLVEDALSTKPKAERITDRLASRFVKLVFAAGLLTFSGWYFLSGNIETALLNTIAVLIVACPCALGLSVPTALVMNTIINSRRGILVKNPDLIENIARLDALIFDKTGTLTKGKMAVTEEKINSTETLLLALAVEKNSTHPVATALTEYLSRKIEITDYNISVVSLEEIAGKGIVAEVELDEKKYRVLVGKKEFVVPGEAEINYETSIHISINNEYSGYWMLNDELRDEAPRELEALENYSGERILLSGDSLPVVKKTAEFLGLKKYYADKTPLEKMEILTALQQQGKIIAMVGDGFNDSACLASSHVGISMGVASDTSIDKADIVLIHNNLAGIRTAIQNARMTLRVIKQNVGMSLFYNSIMIPLAAFGFMLPIICALLMTLSSVSVVTNSLSLQWRRPE